jgi:hypothetical protein
MLSDYTVLGQIGWNIDGGFGTDPAFANASISEISEIDVIAPRPGAPNSSHSSPPVVAQSPNKNNPCMNMVVRVAQGAVGLALALAGAAQAVEGAGQTVFGVVGAPETDGGSLLFVSGGLLNLSLGSTAVFDGANLLYAAIKGYGNPQSAFGQIGQTYGGQYGGLTGEGVNLGAAVLAMATGNPRGRAVNFGLTALQFAVSAACGSE